MPLTVIVGGQFGSEGKGKLCAYLALRDEVDAVVRCGSTNSGHTVVLDGRRWELRMIAAGFVNPTTKLMLPAGALIDLTVLRHEIAMTSVTRDRLIIDRNAGILEQSDVDAERRFDLMGQFGSTQSGVGHALSRRIMRQRGFRLASDVAELQQLATVGDVSQEVNDLLGFGRKVIIEGTQGYGLSLYHTPQFPYATSRDTTAAGFLAEVGTSPRAVDEIILAVRTFPIRVAGRSGPLADEISWEEVRRISGCPYPIRELTTTTKRLRRVAKFDLEFVKRAGRVNGATRLALHGADYLSYANRSVVDYEHLARGTREFVGLLEEEVGVPVSFIGTGPANDETVCRPDCEPKPTKLQNDGLMAAGRL